MCYVFSVVIVLRALESLRALCCERAAQVVTYDSRSNLKYESIIKMGFQSFKFRVFMCVYVCV